MHIDASSPQTRYVVLLLLAMLAVAAVDSRASDGDIALTAGSKEASGTNGTGPLVLAGTRGFTFAGVTLSGAYQPGLCAGSPCLAGDRVSLFATWSGSDLIGVATLDGVTYPRVGDNFDTSPTHASLTAEFHGSFVLPQGSSPTTLVAPFLFTGTLFYAGGPVTMVGSGTATIELSPISGYPEDRWNVREVVYRLGSSLPSPWVAQDIGDTALPGASSLVDRSIVVIGDGADIWGTADSFRFVYQELPRSGAVTARLVTQQRTYFGGLAAPSPFAKAGVMVRESSAADAANVILDVKPDGEIEFMARYVSSSPTLYLGGAPTSGSNVWLSLRQRPDGQAEASYSEDGRTWRVLGSVLLAVGPQPLLAGLAVTSHDPAVLNGAIFEDVTISGGAPANLLTRGDFEEYEPPALGPPGWISDDQLRQVAAKSETHQPRSGSKNGACWTTEFLDCGIYQNIAAPANGTYTYAIYASADRAGGLVGVDVNGANAVSRSVDVRPFGDYALYTMTFTAQAGDTVHVWMYSPAVPGYVVIDDASLTLQNDDRTP
jgi:hypothetical protein